MSEPGLNDQVWEDRELAATERCELDWGCGRLSEVEPGSSALSGRLSGCVFSLSELT